MAIEHIDLVYIGEDKTCCGMTVKKGTLGRLPKSVYESIDVPEWVPVDSKSDKECNNEQEQNQVIV